jgi:hypothetical protein
MPRQLRSSACHVAKISRTVRRRTYSYYLLRRTYREGGKVKHQTLGNLSHLPPHVIEMLRRSLAGEAFVSAQDTFTVVRSLPHGHVAAVLGTLRKLGMDRWVRSPLVVAMIVERLIAPRSKLATARALRSETQCSTLGELLGLSGQVDEEDLYAAMDDLVLRQHRIERKLAKTHLQNGSIALYDLTSTFFEGRCCPLATLGHSRDGKKDRPQVVFGLLCNAEGCPVAVEVFEGNTGDPKTVASQIHKLRTRFGLQRIVLVGDRGMITSARIEADCKTTLGIDWISALRAPQIQSLVSEGTLQLSLFDERDLAEISSPHFPGERLVACRNPLLADERRRKRTEMMAAAERKLETIAAATCRLKRPLRGNAKIAERVTRALARSKMKKYFRLTIEDTCFRYERDAERIQRDAQLDGVYVIRTSVPKPSLDAPQVVSSYKSLAHVERAFRSFKSVDLKVRPIFHWNEDRVKAHIFLCMLAYYVEWHMRQALAPILFDDDDPTTAQAARTSIVAPAHVSPRASRKAQTKRTEEDLPVHSFQTLLRDLATLTKNRMRSKHADPSARFDLVTVPTPTQQRAFDLLGVPLTS